MVKDEIKKQLEQILIEQFDLEIPVQVEPITDMRFGDYSTNIALIAAKKLGESPREIAEKLVASIKNKVVSIDKVEVAGVGFINFWLSKGELVENLSNKQSYLEGTLKQVQGDNSKVQHDNRSNRMVKSPLKGKKVVVEYTDPNPFKEFHIGHLFSNIVGESLSRLFEASGAEVWRADYFGDVGMHVGKAIWGTLSKIKDQKSNIKELDSLELKERIEYMGQGYALGAKAYEEDEKSKEEIIEINRLVYIAAQRMWQKEKGIEPKIDYTKGHPIDEQKLEEIYKIYTVGRKWSLEYFKTIYERLGTKFNGYYPESLAGEKGYQIIMNNIANGVFKKSDNAIVFEGEKYNLHTRVFINALGLPTYETKELGLAPWKHEDFAYDLSVVVTGNEINEYFKVLLAAMKMVYPELENKTLHIGHGMVRLPEGKMSSRTGKVLTGESLLDQAKEEACKLIEQGSRAENSDLAEQIGQAAIKYALLKQNIGRDVIFNFSESINFEGNSGPYLQYTFARTQSVLRRVEVTSYKLQVINYELAEEEQTLLRLLYRFDEIMIEAGEKYSPNTLCTYLYSLAQAFNLFYQKHQILNPGRHSELARLAAKRVSGSHSTEQGMLNQVQHDNVRNFRLMLTVAVGKTIKKGLYLLGIQAPERM